MTVENEIVPPAGDVEVLAVVTLGGYFSSEELGDIDIEPVMSALEQIQQDVVRSDDDEHIELVDRAHVTRLEAEVERYKEAAAGNFASVQDVERSRAEVSAHRAEVMAERDALKAENTRLLERIEQLTYDCQVNCSVVNAQQSELTKVRELLTGYRKITDFTRHPVQIATDEYLAHQSAPASKSCSRVNTVSLENDRYMMAPAAKEGSDE